jgi:hypothetical protein
METRRKHRSLAEAVDLVEEFEQSGQTAVEFCKQRGLTVGTVERLRRRIRDKGSAAAVPGLVPVVVKPVPVARDGARDFVLVLNNGRRIEAAWSCGERDLARLIRIAEAA